VGWGFQKHCAGLGLLDDDIEVDFFDEALSLEGGKLRSNGNETPTGPQDAEGIRDVIHPVGTLKANTRATQGLDQRAKLTRYRGAFFIKLRIGCFLPSVENGNRSGIRFFENFLGDVHLKMQRRLCLLLHL
jgi:hypothetical protein